VEQHRKIEYTKIKLRYHRAKMNFKMLSKNLKRNKRRKNIEIEVAYLIRNIDLYVDDKHPCPNLAEYAIPDIEKLENMNV